MAEIQPIRPDIATPTRMDNPPADERLVGYLEELLAEARAGQIQGMVWSCLHLGDLTSWGRGGIITAGVIGKLEIAKAHCVKSAIEDESED